MEDERSNGGQLILLAGVLLMLAYLLFSSQAAQFQNVGQQSGREARSPVLQDVPLVRRVLSTAFQDELHKEGSLSTAFLCPKAGEFLPRAELILRNIGVHEMNRGLDFSGQVTAVTVAPAPALDAVKVTTDLSLGDGTTLFKETVLFTMSCTTNT